MSCFIALWLAAGMVARGESIRIGYTNCLSVTNYSRSLMTDIGRLKWYFAHASVGENMMSGIADLHGADGNFYPLHSVAASNMPPATTEAGVIYEHNRGNPGWQAKFETFRSCVSNGWRFPLVNLAMNKLCYIDQYASLKSYLNSMTALEAAYPETVFVYTTIPLMTTADSDNFLRNLYNDALRNWTRTNSRVLFDIADIQAHGPKGAPCMFTYKGRACQRLCESYTTDGGHLNAAGRQLVARGYYALAAALLTADRDKAGASGGRKLLAGTHPAEALLNPGLPGPTATTAGEAGARGK